MHLVCRPRYAPHMHFFMGDFFAWFEISTTTTRTPQNDTTVPHMLLRTFATIALEPT